MIKVSEIMSLNPHTISAQSDIYTASQLMQEKQIRHLPVMDNNGVLVGLVSERDLLPIQRSKLTQLLQIQSVDEQNLIKVVDIMSRNVITVSPDAALRDAAIYLQRHRIACLPVIEDNQLVGIVTDSDFVEVAISLLDQAMGEQ